jgi:hypothetical protein
MRMAIHRRAVVMLALMGACGVTAAVADSPPSPAATPATADATSATAPTLAVSPPATPPAAQNATATASAKSADSAAKETEAAQEKALLNAGYRPEMQHGQKVWCRREGETGSRIGEKRVCGTADQLDAVGRQTRQDISDSQKKLNTYPTH